ncbi:hypothetical protein [Glaciibacter superstes]|uniref:hypothetical protein n=1 Tax=Glaciibacter superstes TaxID=501023 RepID=UPI0012F742AC|nr:hypothetical protein [Glaciibacter superstes]
MSRAIVVGDGDNRWSAAAPAELRHHVGAVGNIRTVEQSGARLALLRNAVSRATDQSASAAAVALADICPDPLVFALESGLPRLRLLDRVIDGGSDWELIAASIPSSLTAVSRISEIVGRTSSAGRRLIRTCYETEFRSTRGVLVGRARGFSLDVEGAE